MARCEWAIACVNADESDGEMSLMRVFQVLSLQHTPASASVCCVFGLRGQPGEEVLIRFRLLGPSGELKPDDGFRPVEVTFTEARYFRTIVRLKNLTLDAGNYQMELRRSGASSPMGVCRFEIREDPAAVDRKPH